MYLLWRAGGLPAQEELWGYLADGLVMLHTPETGEWERMRELMRQYHDTPMDLADAFSRWTATSMLTGLMARIRLKSFRRHCIAVRSKEPRKSNTRESEYLRT
jgi:hypothetical protein